ncbi:ATP-binding cassette domain-containing protein [Nocardia sp. NPDC024068]|uniref:ABC transporter ATP-binding protein n=1 Tax=Nocardia sp. NPDC024068 TaxID=3157197 RepID=UPI0033CE99D0
MTGGVTVDELCIRSGSGALVLAPASLRVPPGSVTALTGPSGSGKTTLMRAVFGHLAAGMVRSGGSVHVAGRAVFALDGAALQSFRRRNLAYVSQDPGAALNPAYRIRSLLAESAPRIDEAAMRAALARVGLPERYLRRRPRELSGGEQRRLALAAALVREAGVLVVDEPLAGLHAELRAGVADLLRSIAVDDGRAVLVSGHHTDLIHRLADRVVALGEPPRARAAWSGPGPARATASGPPALCAGAVSATAGGKELLREIDISVRTGEALAIVGPSGAGKTTLARVLTGIHTSASGTLEVKGRALPVGRSRRSRRDRRRIQLVPQDPLSTLNPERTVRQALSRPLRLDGVRARAEITERAIGLLDDVGLEADLLSRYPGELSGGQRQRVAIARALAAAPDVLICDEITSALDDDTAHTVMEQIERARLAHGIGVLVISHDMTLVARYCPRILVLADGAVAEHGETAAVLARPGTTHTSALLV